MSCDTETYFVLLYKINFLKITQQPECLQHSGFSFTIFVFHLHIKTSENSGVVCSCQIAVSSESFTNFLTVFLFKKKRFLAGLDNTKLRVIYTAVKLVKFLTYLCMQGSIYEASFKVNNKKLPKIRQFFRTRNKQN